MSPEVIQKNKIPMWVYLAFPNAPGRKYAVWVTRISLLFSIYCIPWPLFFENQDFLKKICPIENWYWFAAMILMTFWYWLSLKWMDKNCEWSAVNSEQ